MPPPPRFCGLGCAERASAASLARDRDDHEVRPLLHGAELPARNEAGAEGEGVVVGQGEHYRQGQQQFQQPGMSYLGTEEDGAGPFWVVLGMN